jgi:hypothetical protein
MFDKLRTALIGVESALARRNKVRSAIAVQVQKLTSTLALLLESQNTA